MLYMNSFSVISNKKVIPRYYQVLHKPTISISRRRLNSVDVEFCIVPRPSTKPCHIIGLKKKVADSHTRFRHLEELVCYSDQRNCVISINNQEAKQFKERLCNAADLYDGWFSRNVENLDLAPPSSKYIS